MDPRVERIVRPIVEGQIRSFLHDHPELAEAWAGKLPPGKTKAAAVTDSIAKRIVRDLACGGTTARLERALLEPQTGGPDATGVAMFSAPVGRGGGILTAPATPAPTRKDEG